MLYGRVQSAVNGGTIGVNLKNFPTAEFFTHITGAKIHQLREFRELKESEFAEFQAEDPPYFKGQWAADIKRYLKRGEKYEKALEDWADELSLETEDQDDRIRVWTKFYTLLYQNIPEYYYKMAWHDRSTLNPYGMK